MPEEKGVYLARDVYLRRLRQLLLLLVRSGHWSQQSADILLQRQERYYRKFPRLGVIQDPAQTPFYDVLSNDVMWANTVQKALNDLAEKRLLTKNEVAAWERQVKIIQSQGIARMVEARSQLEPYLNAEVSAGRMTPEEARQKEDSVLADVGQGVSFEGTPEGQATIEYFRKVSQSPTQRKASEINAPENQLSAIEKQIQRTALEKQITSPDSWVQMNLESQSRTRNLASQLGMGEGITESTKARQAQEEQYEIADAWEQWRREQSGRLSQSPRNWIQLWQFQHQPNPYAPRYQKGFQDPAERLSELRANVENLRGTVDWVNANPPQDPQSEYGQLAETANVQYQSALQQLGDLEGSMEGGGGIDMRNVAYPQPEGLPLPAPEPWMQTYVPGLTGSQITRQNVPTPSMQQWAGLTSTERSKLLGYTDWLGLSEEDIFGQMERMRPRTPAGAGRWTSVRQR